MDNMKAKKDTQNCLRLSVMIDKTILLNLRAFCCMHHAVTPATVELAVKQFLEKNNWTIEPISECEIKHNA